MLNWLIIGSYWLLVRDMLLQWEFWCINLLYIINFPIGIWYEMWIKTDDIRSRLEKPFCVLNKVGKPIEK